MNVSLNVLSILQNHYVERLGRGLVLNMPWFVNGFFKAISPFMDPITRDKVGGVDVVPLASAVLHEPY